MGLLIAHLHRSRRLWPLSMMNAKYGRKGHGTALVARHDGGDAREIAADPWRSSTSCPVSAQQQRGQSSARSATRLQSWGNAPQSEAEASPRLL